MRIERACDDARDTGRQHCIHARRRSPVMGTRLQGHVHGRASRPVACRLERDDLGMWPALPFVPPFAYDLAVAHDDRADNRVRVRRAAPALGELECPREHQEIA